MATGSAGVSITITGTRDELKAVLMFLLSLKEDEFGYRYNLSEYTYFERIEIGSQRIDMKEIHTESDIDKFLDSNGNTCDVEFEGLYGHYCGVSDAYVFETIADVAPGISISGNMDYYFYEEEHASCTTKDGKLHIYYDYSSYEDYYDQYYEYVESVLSIDMFKQLFMVSDLDGEAYKEIIEEWFIEWSISVCSYSDSEKKELMKGIQSDLKPEEWNNAFDQVKKLGIMEYDDYRYEMRAQEQPDEDCKSIYDPVEHKYIKRGGF